MAPSDEGNGDAVQPVPTLLIAYYPVPAAPGAAAHHVDSEMHLAMREYPGDEETAILVMGQ